ncbi:hypothetical protein AB0877_13870 [Micromonospora sp. NPDC047644]|uniref:hypothetical protein n=1 Tax=Micromonospora sp. NPDC047644 TaxID=3157203 RepID=UPI003455AE1A
MPYLHQLIVWHEVKPQAELPEVEERDQVLLFWTPRVGAVLRALEKLGWDAEQPEPWIPYA